eukprot:1157302-Pelagomonas_calceolata.AAC.16
MKAVLLCSSSPCKKCWFQAAVLLPSHVRQAYDALARCRVMLFTGFTGFTGKSIISRIKFEFLAVLFDQMNACWWGEVGRGWQLPPQPPLHPPLSPSATVRNSEGRGFARGASGGCQELPALLRA